MPRTVVMAFGGNAITRPGEKGTFAEQKANVTATCRQLVDLARAGYRLVLTHGNGPQVGNMLLKNEMAKDVVPAMPLDVLVSNTQGSIGYAIQQALGYELASHGLRVPVAAVVTQVVVAADDPAFQNPTKPVGPFYSQEEAEKLMRERGYRMVEDSHRGWRRVVPSPKPLEIIEREAIKALTRAGIIVVAAGGGGIPVVRRDDGSLEGVEAVIDKDRAATILARQVEAEVLFLLTDVERVCLDYGLPTQREVARLTVSEARRYLAEGQFPPGSMGPKVEAAINFVEAGGEKAIIGSLARAAEAVAGRSGTEIVAG
ncbi:carbamate kinase [Moorella sp. Hama-1]|uniref:carbamate kinase n=1 Tax=Moorella sp. Hama-1 TaxID=2138101 RepID=UPI000D65C64A|nr:carbamate kinase [Moorella sp. Hama-1]BCV22357.1 carbamate kinase [Moorella sp. Hama-1]